MPYISRPRKHGLREQQLAYGEATAEDPGELNYLIHGVVFEYLATQVAINGGVSYRDCGDVLGALEAVKQEFYRRVVAPYEDQKIEENGDVYPQWLLDVANAAAKTDS